MNKPINMMLDEEWISSLKEMARLRSFRENRDISYTDLIREAVANLLNPNKTEETLESSASGG